MFLSPHLQPNNRRKRVSKKRVARSPKACGAARWIFGQLSIQHIGLSPARSAHVQLLQGPRTTLVAPSLAERSSRAATLALKTSKSQVKEYGRHGSDPTLSLPAPIYPSQLARQQWLGAEDGACGLLKEKESVLCSSESLSNNIWAALSAASGCAVSPWQSHTPFWKVNLCVCKDIKQTEKNIGKL